jgi:hypothetical protein
MKPRKRRRGIVIGHGERDGQERRCAKYLCIVQKSCVLKNLFIKKKQQACLGQCIRGLPRLLDTSPKETSHPCHRVLNNESYPAKVRRATRRHLESHNVIYVILAWSMPPKTTHTTEREPSIASKPIGLKGVPSHRTTRKP